MSPAAYALWRDRTSSPHRQSVADVSVHRLTFGRDVLYLSAHGVDGREGVERVAGGEDLSRLHLVVQVGNRFQAEHPDVPVVFAKGRYLLVDVDPQEAIERSRSGCYAIQPIRDSQLVFEARERVAGPENARADVQHLVDQVSGSRLTASVRQLVESGTRESTTDGYRRAADAAKGIFEAVGCSVRLHEFALGSRRGLNVIADRPGSGPSPRRTIVVTAHLDSVNHETPGGPAPGADDNASGAAGVLEIATCVAAHASTHDLRFILFGGEEQGLFGSRAYVSELTPGHGIEAVVNMDMIATINGTSEPTVLIEGGPVSRTLIDRLALAADTYTDLAVQTSLHFANSDHVPFINAAIPAVLLIEGNDSANAHVHTGRDILEHVDQNLMTEIVRMHLAFIADTAHMSSS